MSRFTLRRAGLALALGCYRAFAFALGRRLRNPFDLNLRAELRRPPSASAPAMRPRRIAAGRGLASRNFASRSFAI
jgi:hypothetical protein